MFTLECDSAATNGRSSCNWNMTRAFRQPPYPTEFRAIGVVRGQLSLRPNSDRRGKLTTEDGVVFSCYLLPRISKWLAKNQDALDSFHLWTVYPRMHSGRSKLRLFLQIKGRHNTEGIPAEEVIDVFSIRGIVTEQDEEAGTIAITIERNLSDEQKGLNIFYMQPFIVQLEGFLPKSAVGQFWDVECIREGSRLVLEDASFVTDDVQQTTLSSAESTENQAL